MNILIIGCGILANVIVDKFNKNGHRVYMVTGGRGKKIHNRKVFEQYDFSYDSSSLKDIFATVRPDVTIFMGPYDENFDWSDARLESVKYSAGLMNILSSYFLLNRGRFVYLSSNEVFNNNYYDNISENEEVSPKSFKSMAIVQGENMCSNYIHSSGMDGIIIRYDNLYAVPEKNKNIIDNKCFSMCLEALKTGKISANERVRFSMLYINDAVEYTYNIILSEKPNYHIYHLSSMEDINEIQLAELIKQNMGMDIDIIDNTVGNVFRNILSAARYAEEFPMKVFCHYDEGVRRVADYMKRNSRYFIGVDDSGVGLGGRIWQKIKAIVYRLLPFIENMICFIPFFMLNNRAVGSEYFSKLDFYLLYVLLFAIVYGQSQAIFSALLAVAGYCFRQMYNRSGFDVLLDYNTYVWIAQLFILGMIIGYMRDQLKVIKKEDNERIDYLNGQLEDIVDINDSNVRMKHTFENLIINQQDSVGKIYEITSKLDKYEPEEVLFYAAQVIGELLESKDVAIYTVTKYRYARLFSSTSEKARMLGNSIEYKELTDMYKEIKDKRVYINRNMDDKYPLMASAIFSQERMEFIIMVWGISWERMNLGQANVLTIAGYLIQNAVVRANRYLEALDNERHLDGSSILQGEAFTSLVKAFFEAGEKGLTECAILRVNIPKERYVEASIELSGKLRQSDYIGVMSDGRLYILLGNTSKENASVLIERLHGLGYESRLWEGTLDE